MKPRTQSPRSHLDLSTDMYENPTVTSQPVVRRAHAFVEDVSDDSDDASSVGSTPIETRRNSFFENFMSEEQLAAYAAGIPLPGDLDSPNDGLSLGQRISAFVLPKNFAQVVPNLYRCSFPQSENFPFLRCLRLKTILTLVDEGYSEEHRHFVARGHIQHFQVSIKAHKKQGDKIDESHMLSALKEIMNPANHPMLVHCNKGKHRTGCVMACFRKLLGWPLEDVLEEYRKYAGAKARDLDVEYITGIDSSDLREKLAAQIKSPMLPAEPFAESPLSSIAISSTRLRG